MSDLTHLSLFSGIVPQQFYPIFRGIVEIERAIRCN